MSKVCVLASMLLILGFSAAKVMAGQEPIVYYTFDELRAIAADASGNGNDGMTKGDVKLNNDGKEGKCFEFNGANAYVELQRVVQDDFTLMAWIKTATPGLAGTQSYHGSGLVWSDASGPSNDFAAALLEKKFSFFVGQPNQTIISNTDVVTGEWVHVAATRSAGGKVAIYVNGKMEASMEHPNKEPLTANPIIAIGGNVLDSRYYTGLIDEVKIFDVVLTEEEIQQSVLSTVEPAGKLTVTWGKIKSMF